MEADWDKMKRKLIERTVWDKTKNLSIKFEINLSLIKGALGLRGRGNCL